MLPRKAGPRGDIDINTTHKGPIYAPTHVQRMLGFSDIAGGKLAP